MYLTDRKKIFNAPEKAGSVKEALTQRMDKYKSSAEEAKQEGNGGKARRMTRIVKVSLRFNILNND